MNLAVLSDLELASRFRDLTVEEHENLASQLLHLAEMDRRKLFFHYSSLRAYLVAESGMEEWQAERRIRAARMMKRFPFVLKGIESGRLNLTLLEIAQACAHSEKLSNEELAGILEAIAGMSCRAARRELAARYPRMEAELPPDRVRPLTENLSEVRFVATEELLGKLDEIRGLLAHAHPKGLSLRELIDVIASEYRERHHPEAKARRAQERAEKKADGEGRVNNKSRESIARWETSENQSNRESQEDRGREESARFESDDFETHKEKLTEIVEVPAAQLLERSNRELSEARPERRIFSKKVGHELILRDGYRCAYVDPVTAMRCESSFKLEKDHIRTWSSGGKTVLANARYLCAQHHRRVSFTQFGESARYFTVR